MIPSLRGPRRALASVLLIGLVLVACSTSSSSNAATVGDAEITNAQLEADTHLFGFLSGLSGNECGTPVEGETQESACARLVLSNDIREELVKSYATENGLVVEQAAVDDALGQLEQSVGGAETLDAQLAEVDLTRAQLEGLARRFLLFNVVQEAVVADELDDEALRAAYEDQLGTFTTVEVRHILVEDEADAERIAAEVTSETFAEVAERESIDTGSAQNGGSLGSYSEEGFRTQFIPEFVDATLALDVGEISQPVRSEFGWHVIQLVRRDVAPFEEVRDQLLAQQAPTVFDAWFREQADATEVDVNPRYGRYDLETLEVVPVRSTAEEPATEEPTGVTAPAPTGS